MKQKQSQQTKKNKPMHEPKFHSKKKQRKARNNLVGVFHKLKIRTEENETRFITRVLTLTKLENGEMKIMRLGRRLKTKEYDNRSAHSQNSQYYG